MSRRGRLASFDPDRPGPYLKWAGNKAFLAAPEHIHLVPTPAPGGRWAEPFCGAAGLFFSLPSEHRRRALLSDINPRIVGVHLAVRDHVEEVIGQLTEIRAQRHSYEEDGPHHVATHYSVLRDQFNAPGLDPASAEAGALFIALNKLCINGLFRENADGQFNVSMGDYTSPAIFDADHLRACSRALADVDLRVLDNETAMGALREGDVTLLDPPYEPTSKTASFTSYSRGAGDWSTTSPQLLLPGCGGENKRQRLANGLADLDARGVRFTVTDADTPATRELYARWNLCTVQVPRSISRNGGGRQAVSELVARNWLGSQET